ncbi:flagellar basal body P-ring protein FlgI [Buchnera aphidicola]|uniref:flagellar basal body P-ring protein FlgI n=1 Tax=Buchnera aphidicola TaxID=9 RepID=UPI0031B707D2
MNIIKLIYICIIITLSKISICQAEKIQNLVNIKGIQNNQLIGYGLVAGLKGTGDSNSPIAFSNHVIHNMLSQLGIKIPVNNKTPLNNVASVIITANLPYFSSLGETININVASIGNAKNLEGGTLLLTPLKNIDNKICAFAQGLISKKKTNFQNISKKSNFYTIKNGAIIKKEIKHNLLNKKNFKLQLKKESFTLSKKISDCINIHYPNIATPIDSKTIKIKNFFKKKKIVEMVSNIQNININIPKKYSNIIFNFHTNSVIFNSKIKLHACTLINKKFLLIIKHKKKYPINFTLLKGIKKNKKIKKRKLNLYNIIQILNYLKIKYSDIFLILKNMHDAGCFPNKVKGK